MDHFQRKQTTLDNVDAVAFFQNEHEQGEEWIFQPPIPYSLPQDAGPSLHLPAFALLIDADNVAVEAFADMMEHVERWGSVTLRRAYGNQEALLGPKWKDLCLQYAIQPMIHLGISGVKNATDIALTVDAMDLFHTQAIRHFCLATGDQDFTSLILRLRSYGCHVYSIGKRAKAFARVCTAYVALEDLPQSNGKTQEGPVEVSTAAPIAPVNGAKALKKKQAKASASPTKVPVKAATPAKKEQSKATTSAKKEQAKPATPTKNELPLV